MATFTFTGDWVPHIEIPALNEFKLTYNVTTPVPGPSTPRTIDPPVGFSGMTFLAYACKCGNEELIRYILSRKPPSLKGCMYYLPDNREMIQLLLDAGADINDCDRHHRTVVAGKVDTLRELYAKGAAPGLIDEMTYLNSI
ncbi:ankyrin repeat domain-containing protein [Dawidia soli]|uniref:Uncharacterized protein n=1 Tax=Dawidia soli TaxID=2782352 RepID=A0AAP2D788_9BACT|nr:hypothetical protein [Dawidia soli]MBT1686417.1 hypothetical protein [Dawidia soli]